MPPKKKVVQTESKGHIQKNAAKSALQVNLRSAAVVF